MRKQVTVTIDGSPVRVPEGTPLLDAAMEYGICIPHLCHVAGLAPNGVCRLCLVEVGNGKRPRVTTSCTLEAKAGLVVQANSDRVKALRRNVAELLVAKAPNSRAIQDLAVRCGVKDVRYPFHHADCVQCGRCVRVCRQMWQAKAIGFVGRGKERRVDYPFGVRPESCKRCYSCIDICPMTVTPCPGPMKHGEEHLCGLCEGQLSMTETMPDTCVMCELGKGFQCARQRA